ncbi:hypothetical protein ANANG_G00202710 [Anguilla anguilla]|uniref:Uncharacterized protein n=1 Tax=Anguilla anguilla TaxID=7936 RepID=A0A9D3RQN5_ANGAN|nr:hypothetical protein ANANG_G00202710 [Anguilla anguilla]
MAPPPPLYSPMAAPFQQLPHLQSCQLIGSPLAFHSAPPMAQPPPSRPSYPPLQHSLPYNGQPGLPMSAGSPRPTSACPSSLTPGAGRGLPLWLHPSVRWQPAPLPPALSGLPLPQPGAVPRRARLLSLAHLQQPPGAPAFPQAGSPGVGSLPSVGPLVPPLGPQPPFSPEEERLSIKQEPEDKELGFHSIGLQDITLDDVNEIIGRDMSQSPASHGPTATHSQT